MRPIFVIALLASFAGFPVFAQEEGDATVEQQSPGFPILYESNQAKVTAFGYLRAGTGWRAGATARSDACSFRPSR